SAALNRRDFWITQGMYPGIKTPVILGSDGAGEVTAIGEGVDEHWNGKSIVVNPGIAWGSDLRAQHPDFRILGMPDDGTFAEQVVVDATLLCEKPEHLDWHQAAALPLAGVTAYRAVFTQGQVAEGQKVLVTGIGGGVATFALQFAKHAGAQVIVTSSSEAKLEKARGLGATAAYNYKEDGWHKRMLEEIGPVNLIIDSAAGAGYRALLDLADFGGRIVNYGATTGPPEKVDMFKVFWKQLTLQGSTMGSPVDFAKMVDFVKSNSIVPAIDEVFALQDGNDALARMRDSQQFGKLVLNINDA
ncbi:MAG: zinc-binding dehydrogenase, partial [Planctomycetota bacterium]